MDEKEIPKYEFPVISSAPTPSKSDQSDNQPRDNSASNQTEFYRDVFSAIFDYVSDKNEPEITSAQILTIVRDLLDEPVYDHEGLGIHNLRGFGEKVTTRHQWQKYVLNKIREIHKYALSSKKEPVAPPPSLILYRDEPLENIENTFELSPLRGVDDKERLALENIDYKTLAAYIAQLEALDPEFDAVLKAARTARQAFGEAAKPPMPLPTVAPQLWRDHPPGMTATEFVRQVYAPWIEAGVLTRKSIEDCDPALANAYSKRKSAYPDEAIPLARAVHPRTIADPQQAGEHYRAKGRERTARYRNRDKIAHEPD